VDSLEVEKIVEVLVAVESRRITPILPGPDDPDSASATVAKPMPMSFTAPTNGQEVLAIWKSFGLSQLRIIPQAICAVGVVNGVGFFCADLVSSVGCSAVQPNVGCT